MMQYVTLEDKVQTGIRTVWQKMGILGKDRPKTQEEAEAAALMDIYTMIQRARKEWENACAFMNEAAGPDLVDHAVHGLIAAEHKYDYFIKLAKQQNLRNGGVPHDV